MLDELHGLLISNKKTAREIDNELKIHTPMLQNLEKQMDSVQSRMKRAQNKLNQYFQKSSSSCLMTTICLEIVMLLAIILLL
jgi:DNA-binding transcriptional regulator GbsR (MarR family)